MTGAPIAEPPSGRAARSTSSARSPSAAALSVAAARPQSAAAGDGRAAEQRHDRSERLDQSQRAALDQSATPRSSAASGWGRRRSRFSRRCVCRGRSTSASPTTPGCRGGAISSRSTAATAPRASRAPGASRGKASVQQRFIDRQPALSAGRHVRGQRRAADLRGADARHLHGRGRSHRDTINYDVALARETAPRASAARHDLELSGHAGGARDGAADRRRRDRSDAAGRSDRELSLDAFPLRADPAQIGHTDDRRSVPAATSIAAIASISPPGWWR